MYSDGSALKRVTRDECLQLMASVPVGRIIYTRQALPAVELVNFAIYNGDIIIRTDRSGKLAAATRGAVVAFEADSLNTEQHVGWSVTVVGQSQEVTDPDEIDRLAQIGFSSWAPGGETTSSGSHRAYSMAACCPPRVQRYPHRNLSRCADSLCAAVRAVLAARPGVPRVVAGGNFATPWPDPNPDSRCRTAPGTPVPGAAFPPAPTGTRRRAGWPARCSG